MNLTNTWNKLAKRKERIVVQQGGTSSGKTYATLQLLIQIAQKYPNILISVVAESLPHLKRGAMRDFFKILMEEGIYEPKNHNKTDHQYKIDKSIIEFFGADSADKMRGSRRDILYINECNNVSYNVYDQLEVRTKWRIYLDYNPVSEFWVHDRVIPLDNVGYVHSTYKDNDQLDEQIIKSIETRKDIDPNWWKVYGLGEVGSLEGVIFNNWTIEEELPEEAELIAYGLDFGFTNDPTALIAVYRFDSELWLDELIYETGLTNDDLANKITPEGLVIADSAEPKSIETLRRLGWDIMPTEKGKDSINAGISTLQSYKINVTKTSLNLIKELRNYQWLEDKNGNLMNRPIDDWNHALDAVRYVALKRLKSKQAFSWLDNY